MLSIFEYSAGIVGQTEDFVGIITPLNLAVNRMEMIMNNGEASTQTVQQARALLREQVWYSMSDQDIASGCSMLAKEAERAVIKALNTGLESAEKMRGEMLNEFAETVAHEKSSAWLGWTSVTPGVALRRLAERIIGRWGVALKMDISTTTPMPIGEVSDGVYMELARSASALVVATDGREELREERQAVVKVMKAGFGEMRAAPSSNWNNKKAHNLTGSLIDRLRQASKNIEEAVEGPSYLSRHYLAGNEHHIIDEVVELLEELYGKSQANPS